MSVIHLVRVSQRDKIYVIPFSMYVYTMTNLKLVTSCLLDKKTLGNDAIFREQVRDTELKNMDFLEK